ncbi:MAG: DeoR/GlpR family DNA-binding transcription regulator [Actinomycetota bacterium]|nr:DeoR/GlpR family DNA-binding transcription regulator [Actinomycetota bacterium]
MYALERQQRILQEARERGRVEVVLLAPQLGVTTETIRRDLTALERHGLLRRVHGGAIPLDRIGFEPGLATRDAILTAEKERIAKAALGELPTEGAILLDSGTTTARLADALPDDRDLTIVTNSLPIAMSLSGRPNLTLLFLGGRVRGRTLAAVDVWAMRALEDTFVDIAFVGTNGFSVQRGLTTPDPTEAAVKRAMIGAARRSVVLADHTKFGNDTFMRFGSLQDVDTLITDSGLNSELSREIESTGVKVLRA